MSQFSIKYDEDGIEYIKGKDGSIYFPHTFKSEIKSHKFIAEDAARIVYLKALSEGIDVTKATDFFWGEFNRVRGILD